MTHVLFACIGLLVATLPAAAQSAALLPPDSPAAYRQQALHGPEHARLVSELLRYELRNIHLLVTSQVLLRPGSYSYTLTNRATVAEVTGGTYTLTYYDAQGQVLDTATGRFSGMAPGASRNQTASFPRPADTARAELSVTAVEAE